MKDPKGGEGVRSLVKAMTSPGSRLITHFHLSPAGKGEKCH
jgi:hypothetical protein